MHIYLFHIAHTGWIILYSRYYWLEMSYTSFAASLLLLQALLLATYAVSRKWR
jgi:hypothetical protein